MKKNVLPKMIVFFTALMAISFTGCGSGGGDGGDQTISPSWNLIGLNSKQIKAIAIDPTNSQVIYAGISDGDPSPGYPLFATTGSVYKSIDGGNSWSKVNDINFRTNSIVIDPTNNQIVYVGTSYGMYKTINGGNTWYEVNTGLSEPPSEYDDDPYPSSEILYIYSLYIDPNDNQVFYADTAYGMYKTINSGNSWTLFPFGGENKFAIDPTNSQIMYCGTSFGVYKSIDGGNSCSKLSSMDFANSFAIDPANGQIVYAGTHSGVKKSIDGGNSWSTSTSNTYSCNLLSIDPNNTQVIYSGYYYNGVFKSADGGNSWNYTGCWGVNTIAIDPNNSQMIYAGTDHGIYKLL